MVYLLWQQMEPNVKLKYDSMVKLEKYFLV